MAPVSKRTRENSSGDIKVTATSEAATSMVIKILNKRFEEQEEINARRFLEQADFISTKIGESEQRILQMLHDRIEGLNRDMQSLLQRVEQLEKQSDDVRGLRVHVGNLEKKLADQSTSTVAHDIRLHGVPFVQGESLRSLFNTLSFSIGVTPAPRLRDIFRVKPANRANTIVDPIIIVKLDNQSEKIRLLHAAATFRREAKQQLTLRLMGFDSDALIYLNEQLTKENYNIFKEAMKMKKHKLLTAVFCRRSLVHVKKNERGRVICVDSMQKLSQLRADPDDPEQSLADVSSAAEPDNQPDKTLFRS
ncbi:hypothetical protein KR084_008982 [Drosophila pseudotakahashii]|nr:hypothetical protein KR084_008982 [Drosophila pseudotakahashii]